VLHLEHQPPRPGQRAVGIDRALELPDLEGAAVRGHEEHVGEAADRVVRGEREAQESLLPAVQHVCGEVGERRRRHGAVLDEPHGPAALDHEEARAVVRRRSDRDRDGELADGDQGGRRRGSRGQRQQHQRGEQGGAHQWSATVPSSGSSG
jgi:hypothetical protein